MNLELLYHPHKSEEVSVTVGDNDYNDLTYNEWVELLSSVTTGDVSYSTWLQDNESGEMNVLHHNYKLKNGEVVSYDQELEE